MSDGLTTGHHLYQDYIPGAVNIAVEDENIKLQKDIAEWQSEQLAKAI